MRSASYSTTLRSRLTSVETIVVISLGPASSSGKILAADRPQLRVLDRASGCVHGTPQRTEVPDFLAARFNASGSDGTI
jgi:hypothetical protein